MIGLSLSLAHMSKIHFQQWNLFTGISKSRRIRHAVEKAVERADWAVEKEKIERQQKTGAWLLSRARR